MVGRGVQGLAKLVKTLARVQTVALTSEKPLKVISRITSRVYSRLRHAISGWERFSTRVHTAIAARGLPRTSTTGEWRDDERAELQHQSDFERFRGIRDHMAGRQIRLRSLADKG